MMWCFTLDNPTGDRSATHTTLALLIASINHACSFKIALDPSLMCWVYSIFIPMLYGPTTRTAIILASHIIIWCTAQPFDMASTVQSRLDDHCNNDIIRSLTDEMIRICRWLGRFGIWLTQLRSKWRWCDGHRRLRASESKMEQIPHEQATWVGGSKWMFPSRTRWY